ncbi:MAG TPA: cellulose biosynthesis protein BcsP [Paraburkholderia sp.]|nr:cellulose biosynthesis protein BcsP [Paraburkholderia sp.]
MSVSDDVGNLFRRFGGDAGQYQEVARDDEAKQAALRWPLLNALDIAHAAPVPEAGRLTAQAASSDHRVEPAVSSSQEDDAAQAANSASGSNAPARLPLFARGHRHATMPPPVAPAQTGANRFSAPPAIAPATERSHAAANAPSMSAATPEAGIATQAAVAQAAAPTQPAQPVAPVSRVSAPQTRREGQAIPAAPFLSQRQTFAPTPFNNPLPEAARAVPSNAARQQGGSILSGLFAGKHSASSGAPSAAPSKDLSTLFARLAGAPAAPSRSLRDTFRSRFKADGDA